MPQCDKCLSWRDPLHRHCTECGAPRSHDLVNASHDAHGLLASAPATRARSALNIISVTRPELNLQSDVTAFPADADMRVLYFSTPLSWHLDNVVDLQHPSGEAHFRHDAPSIVRRTVCDSTATNALGRSVRFPAHIAPVIRSGSHLQVHTNKRGERCLFWAMYFGCSASSCPTRLTISTEIPLALIPVGSLGALSCHLIPSTSQRSNYSSLAPPPSFSPASLPPCLLPSAPVTMVVSFRDDWTGCVHNTMEIYGRVTGSDRQALPFTTPHLMRGQALASMSQDKRYTNNRQGVPSQVSSSVSFEPFITPTNMLAHNMCCFPRSCSLCAPIFPVTP